MKKRVCPGCRESFVIKGGALRVPSEDEPVGYVEFPICKPCAKEFQKIERMQSENSVQKQPTE